MEQDDFAITSLTMASCPTEVRNDVDSAKSLRDTIFTPTGRRERKLLNSNSNNVLFFHVPGNFPEAFPVLSLVETDQTTTREQESGV
jgi:hypothetical protein